MKWFWILMATVNLLGKTDSAGPVYRGSVLFTPGDMRKECWSETEKALLIARQMMQDLLPEPQSLDFSKPGTFRALLEYFQSCFSVITLSTQGKSQHLMSLALADAVGGYLKCLILPVLRRAFYAGQVGFKDAKAFHQLYENIKAFLHTTGVGWRRSHGSVATRFDIKALKINTAAGSHIACSRLYIIEQCASDVTQRAAEHVNNEKEPSLLNMDILDNQKFVDEELKLFIQNDKNKSLGEEVNKKRRKQAVRKVLIPLPLLDSSESPNVIAVPLKDRPLNSLRSSRSAFILEKYYATAIKCICTRKNSEESIKRFNGKLHSWLVTEVFPHLNNEEWYPAFGGVLRIVQTIKTYGLNREGPGLEQANDQFLFSEGIWLDEPDTVHLQNQQLSNEDTPSSRIYLMAMTSLILIGFITICCCGYKRYKKKTVPEHLPHNADDNRFTVQFIIRFFKRITRMSSTTEAPLRPSPSNPDLRHPAEPIQKSDSILEIQEEKLQDEAKVQEVERSSHISLTELKSPPRQESSDISTAPFGGRDSDAIPKNSWYTTHRRRKFSAPRPQSDTPDTFKMISERSLHGAGSQQSNVYQQQESQLHYSTVSPSLMWPEIRNSVPWKEEQSVTKESLEKELLDFVSLKPSKTWPESAAEMSPQLLDNKSDNRKLDQPATLPHSSILLRTQHSCPDVSVEEVRIKSFWKTPSSSRSSIEAETKTQTVENVHPNCNAKYKIKFDDIKVGHSDENLTKYVNHAQACSYSLMNTSTNSCSNTQREYSSADIYDRIIACHRSANVHDIPLSPRESGSDTSERESVTTSSEDSSFTNYISYKEN